ncbi:GDSL family lipase [Ramlibacter terrae]|uniref:GDSL family lipase n=1 Tax=Ramlibacter terrae TaxID=2732511 RepID=A0ABX6P4K8_9BURK|nr:GDSL family lipase [Ramlibacter terrae]
MTRRPNLIRPLVLLALLGAAATAGCSAWKMREAGRLARDSEPFQAQPASAVASLLVVGDSTAVGTGASDPTRSVAGLLAADLPKLRVVNRATDGARYEDIVRQLQADTSRFDAVLVPGGGNDVIRNTGTSELTAQVRQAADLAKQIAPFVVMMPPGNVGNAPFFWRPLAWWMDRRSQMLHTAVRQAAQATGATYVNLYKPRAEDPFAQRPRELHARDGLHPSDAGYALWVKELEAGSGLKGKLGKARGA